VVEKHNFGGHGGVVLWSSSVPTEHKIVGSNRAKVQGF
jgi:hypothetical protein